MNFVLCPLICQPPVKVCTLYFSVAFDWAFHLELLQEGLCKKENSICIRHASFVLFLDICDQGKSLTS